MIERNSILPALFVVALALAACQQSADEGNITIDNGVNAAEAANADIEALPPSDESGPPAALDSGGRINGADDAGSEDTNIAVIPVQYRGRWGIVAADCTSTRGDAKGLIVIGDSNIRFYESTATLKRQRPAIATSFSGLYGFTGEGQTWDKIVTLTRNGDTLQRADDDGRYSYQRCA
ncbi:MAG: hypothetical protein M3Q88_01375 [Pseudomonadota bacterium]|nr:hypothetical protein [Pseudomonadota bacterium]